MQNNDINSSGIDESLFDLPLDDVPNTHSLKSRILQVTQDLPQKNQSHLNIQMQSRKLVGFLSDFFQPKYIGTFALAASFALVAVLWLPNMSEQATSNINNLSSQNAFTIEDELDFEEAMILYDEQLFAQL